MEADQELFAIFRVEVEEQIEDLCDRLARATSRWRIDRLFQISHNVKGAARLVGVDSVRDAAHALEDLFSAIRDGLELGDEVVELAREGAELLEACFGAIDDGTPPDIDHYRERVQALIGGSEKPTRAAKETEPRPTGGEARTGPAAGGAPPADQGTSSAAPLDQATATVRVSAAKLDALLGLASEFVTHVFQVDGHRELAKRAQSRIALTLQTRPELKEDPELHAALAACRELASDLSDHATEALRVSDDLQGSVRSLRMVRIEGLRTLLSRSVRDACKVSGCQARLDIAGGDTEVDRALLEQLRDPLVHLLRNAVAHGIEPGEERTRNQKDPVGKIELQARSVGPWVEIVVADDGRGIDPQKVRDHALASGMISADELKELDDSGVLDLLFQAGLSTTDTVTELAGRGVGLDVVRSRMVKLGGTVSVTSSLGGGARITMRLPLTRLTTSGILARLNGQRFAVPTTDVERTILVKRTDVVSADGAEAVRVDGRLVRIAQLASILGTSSEEKDSKPALVVSVGMRRRALLVDEVCGQRDYIVQPPPWNLRDARWLAGSTVLDGGEVVLVLDSRQLVGIGKSSTPWRERGEERQYRVLVVDDSATSRTLERNILSAAGYQVLTAINGVEALRILADEDIDMVVSDVEMPTMNGFDLTRAIRADVKLEHLPVILVTSLGSGAHKQQGAEAGADAYIVKGAFDQDELLTTIARLL